MDFHKICRAIFVCAIVITSYYTLYNLTALIVDECKKIQRSHDHAVRVQAMNDGYMPGSFELTYCLYDGRLIKAGDTVSYKSHFVCPFNCPNCEKRVADHYRLNSVAVKKIWQLSDNRIYVMLENGESLLKETGNADYHWIPARQ